MLVPSYSYRILPEATEKLFKKSNRWDHKKRFREYFTKLSDFVNYLPESRVCGFFLPKVKLDSGRSPIPFADTKLFNELPENIIDGEKLVLPSKNLFIHIMIKLQFNFYNVFLDSLTSNV